MSTWYIKKNGISLNEGGRWITFCFIKLADDEAKHFFPKDRWLFRIWIKLPFSKYAHMIESIVAFRKISFKE